MHPAFSTSDLEVKRRRHSTLKRLDFVRAYTEYYWSKANTIAQMVCSDITSFNRASRPLCDCNCSLRRDLKTSIVRKSLPLSALLMRSLPQEERQLR